MHDLFHSKTSFSAGNSFYNRLSRSIISLFSFNFALSGAKIFASLTLCANTLVTLGFGVSVVAELKINQHFALVPE